MIREKTGKPSADQQPLASAALMSQRHADPVECDRQAQLCSGQGWQHSISILTPTLALLQARLPESGCGVCLFFSLAHAQRSEVFWD